MDRMVQLTVRTGRRRLVSRRTARICGRSEFMEDGLETMSDIFLENQPAQDLVNRLRNVEKKRDWESTLSSAMHKMHVIAEEDFSDPDSLKILQEGLAASVITYAAWRKDSKFYPDSTWEMLIPEQALHLALHTVRSAISAQEDPQFMVWNTPREAADYVESLESLERSIERDLDVE